MQIQRIDCLDDIKNKLDLYGNVYRGCSNSLYELIPTVGRIHNTSLQMEKQLVNQFIAHEECKNTELTLWDYLVLAQHYGIPTRLLDWTLNPYIALFFAARRNRNSDFKVFSAKVPINDSTPKLSPFEVKEPIFFRPSIADKRILNQESVFSIQGNPTTPLEVKDLCVFIFSVKLRSEVFKLCESVNITKDYLFPTELTAEWHIK